MLYGSIERLYRATCSGSIELHVESSQQLYEDVARSETELRMVLPAAPCCLPCCATIWERDGAVVCSSCFSSSSGFMRYAVQQLRQEKDWPATMMPPAALGQGCERERSEDIERPCRTRILPHHFSARGSPRSIKLAISEEKTCFDKHLTHSSVFICFYLFIM